MEHRDGIKNYIVSLIISKSSDESALVRERVFISKLNMILVQVRLMVAFVEIVRL